MEVKRLVKNLPLLGPVARKVYRSLLNRSKRFPGSESYWNNRYEAGGNSGDGSYNHLAEFKAEILNQFVHENKVSSVIEYGCGDGNQLSLANYPRYTGYDVSAKAVSMCTDAFAGDDTKSFRLLEPNCSETAELTLSLDVIYHLIENSIYTDYMNRLFDSSEKYVAIYSSDTDDNPIGTAAHVRHRNFSKWVRSNKPEWKLLKHIPNRFPYDGDNKRGSFADFYIYQRNT